jgi:hypothetical protein
MPRLLVTFLFMAPVIFGCGSTQNQPDNPGAGPQAESTPDSGPMTRVEPPPPLEGVQTERCELVLSQLAVRLPRPEGFLFHCDATQGAARSHEGTLNPMESDMLLQSFAIRADDAGPEQELNQPDGARRWVLAVGVLGPNAAATVEGTIVVSGHQERYFLIVGRPQGMSERREVVVTRIRAGEHNVVLIALYPPDSPEQRNRALALLQTARVEVLAVDE